jgi:tetratricopeptide (TPR) repeat protein
MSPDSSVESLFELLEVDPAAVIDTAPSLVAGYHRSGDRSNQTRVLRALGLAHLRSGDPARARQILDEALAVAPDRVLWAEVMMSRVGPLAELGLTTDAQQAADLAVAGSEGLARARAIVQRTVLAFRMGGRPELVAELDEAEAELRRAGDRAWLARLLTNRAHMRAFLGQYREADHDVEAANRLLAEDGAWGAVAGGVVLRSELAARQGDLVTALRFLDEVSGASNGVNPGHLELHRSDVLMAAGLSEDAIAAIERAIESFTMQGLELARAEATLALAQALRALERLGGAEQAAAASAELFVALGRRGWVELARLIELEARLVAGEPAEVDRAIGLGRSAVEAGLIGPGTAAVLRLVESALLARRRLPDEAIEEWIERARRLHRPDLRIQSLHIQALRHLTRGDRGRAYRSIRVGMSVFDDHQASLGGTEMRVHAARQAAALGRTALGLAASAGRPWHLLQWMERTRAGSLRLPGVNPPDDPQMAADLGELRALDERARSGDHTVAGLQARLAERIRQRARLVEGEGVAGHGLERDVVLDRLGQGALIALDEIDGRLVGVAVTRRKSLQWEVGSVEELAGLSDGMRFAVQRLATGRGSSASLAAARSALDHDASALARRLLPDLGQVDRLVISPPSRLHSLPYGALPVRVPITVTPSVQLWSRGAPVGPIDSALLVAGADLAHARREVEALGALHPRSVALVDGDATVDAVLHHLEGKRIAHFASHGTFRADNPLFSALLLADGGLNVYAIQQLRRPPAIVVLSACDSGLSKAHPGNELMGLLAGLLGGGTASVIASIGLFPDSEETIEVMREIHRRLTHGETASESLAAVVAAGGSTGAAATALVCFGAG